MPKKVFFALFLFLLFSLTKVSAANLERFAVDFKNTPLRETLLSLGYRANADIIVNGDIAGIVSLSLQERNIYEILELLAITHGFTYQCLDDVILISPAETMTLTKSYYVKHVNLDTLKKQVTMFVPEKKITVNLDDSTLLIDGSPSQHAKVAELLTALDRPISQIKVQATVIEISREKGSNVGLEYNFGDYARGQRGGVTYTIVPRMERTAAEGSILAQPSVMVANGNEASILMGDKVPVFTSEQSSGSSLTNSTVSVEYKDVGVNLKVTPRINDYEEETITLALKPEISSITRWVESGNNKAPQISSREVSTVVRVKSGESIVIGGLFKEDDVKNIKGIPFLSKLPFLGQIFRGTAKSKTRTEILIAITPYIVRGEAADKINVVVPQIPETAEAINRLHPKPQQKEEPAQSSSEDNPPVEDNKPAQAADAESPVEDNKTAQAADAEATAGAPAPNQESSQEKITELEAKIAALEEKSRQTTEPALKDEEYAPDEQLKQRIEKDYAKLKEG